MLFRSGQPQRYVFRLAGVPTAAYQSPVDRQEELHLLDGIVNGARLNVERPQVTVARGERLSGTIRFLYTTGDMKATYVLAHTATWHRRDRDTLTLMSLIPGIADAHLMVGFSATAPPTPGNYWLLWAQQSEPAAKWILSSTSWACGSPIWDDGNDLGAQPDSVLAQAVAAGSLAVPFTYCWDGPPRRAVRTIPVIGVRVVVR